MGSLQNVEFLGEDFSRFVYPTVMVFVAILVVFRFDARIYQCFGVSQYDFDEKHRDEQMAQGR